MPVTDQEFAQLSRRVAALEQSDAANTKSIEFIASTLAGVKTVQDGHTKRLDRIEAKLTSLADTLPSIVADAMREVMKGEKGGKGKKKP